MKQKRERRKPEGIEGDGWRGETDEACVTFIKRKFLILPKKKRKLLIKSALTSFLVAVSFSQ